MTLDTRTAAEIAYDATKLSRTADVWEDVQQITDDPTNDGSAAVWAEIIDIITDPTNDGADIPLSADEEAVLDILLARPVVPSRDAAHREERMVTILEQIADMDEPAQAKALRMLERALDAA